MGKGVLLRLPLPLPLALALALELLLAFDFDDATPRPLLDKDAILTDVGHLVVVELLALTTVLAVPMGLGLGEFLAFLLLLPLSLSLSLSLVGAIGCHTRGNRTLDNSWTRLLTVSSATVLVNNN